MISGSKLCGVLCWILLASYMCCSLLTADWAVTVIIGGFMLCVIGAFLFYAFAPRGAMPKSKVGLYVTICAVIVAVLLQILPMFVGPTL
jgi:hypothetical protein